MTLLYQTGDVSSSGDAVSAGGTGDTEEEHQPGHHHWQVDWSQEQDWHQVQDQNQDQNQNQNQDQDQDQNQDQDMSLQLEQTPSTAPGCSSSCGSGRSCCLASPPPCRRPPGRAAQV